MADPFEVRMRFTSLLSHLNASTTSATKCATYALKHSEYSDDLHSCILEQLERNNMNNRANIMYFLPALCDTARAQDEPAYVRMMERDILTIVDLVAPDDGSGAANVKVVRKVLKDLGARGVLQAQTVVELEECIAGRDAMGALPSSPGGLRAPSGGGGGTTEADGSGVVSVARSTPVSTQRDAHGYQTPAMRLDKRQIEQRIEEDRERHKRAREGIWAVRQESSSLAEDGEFDRMWEDASDVDDDDYALANEQKDERRRCLEFEESGT